VLQLLEMGEQLLVLSKQGVAVWTLGAYDQPLATLLLPVSLCKVLYSALASGLTSVCLHRRASPQQ
jgi:hypothetical protein